MRWRPLLLVLLAAAVGLSWLAFDLFFPFRGYAGNIFVVIEPGSGASQVTELLVARGVLKHRLPFLVRYWVGRPRHTLRAGEYLFDHPLRPIDVYRRLVQGDIYLHTVVIPEGSDRFDIARILNLRLGIDPDQFLRTTQQTMPIHDLDPHAPSLEGYLFPDTYRFARGVSAATVVLTMLVRFRHILPRGWQANCLPPPLNPLPNWGGEEEALPLVHLRREGGKQAGMVSSLWPRSLKRRRRRPRNGPSSPASLRDGSSGECQCSPIPRWSTQRDWPAAR